MVRNRQKAITLYKILAVFDDHPLNGREIGILGRDLFETMGWTVYTSEHNGPIPTGLAGIFDDWLLHPKHGMIVIERKAASDKYRQKQLVFRNVIEALAKRSKLIRYVEINTWEEYQALADYYTQKELDAEEKRNLKE